MKDSLLSKEKVSRVVMTARRVKERDGRAEPVLLLRIGKKVIALSLPELPSEPTERRRPLCRGRRTIPRH